MPTSVAEKKASNKKAKKTAKKKREKPVTRGGDGPPEGTCWARMDLPLSTKDPVGHVGKRIDVMLNRRQSLALRALADALVDRGAILHEGRRVVTHVDAARWFLSFLADHMEEGRRILMDVQDTPAWAFAQMKTPVPSVTA